LSEGGEAKGVELRLAQAVLRPWSLADAASLVEQANNLKVARNMRDTFPHPYRPADAEEWLQRGHTNGVHLAVEVAGKAVGGIGLMPKSDVVRRSAEIGYWLGEAYWGRGIATDAVRAVTAYAFDGLDLIRLYARVFAWNPASARVLEKAGYQLEGRLRNAVTKAGETTDALLYAIIKDETDRS
jgi:RimJ/RimL family protein N-acetyltransferase